MASAAAQLPPALAELKAEWSRLVEVPLADGSLRTFHVLDRPPPAGGSAGFTVLCVHGNPSWSYLWRRVLSAAPDDVRIVAPDHLNMGYSERTGNDRSLADRIDDLHALTDALEVTGPVVVVAHDWGGPIALGWAHRHREQLAGVALANTAVSQPADAAPPWLITTIGSQRLLRTMTQRTPAFIRGALRLSVPEPSAEVRSAYLAPYDSPERRSGIRAFVADIPLDPAHRSFATLEAVAAGLEDMEEMPAALFWGPNDPVFSERYLHDLEARLPHAQVHRFAGASHFVTEDAPFADAFWTWVGSVRNVDERTKEGLAPRLSRSLIPVSSEAGSPLVVEPDDDGWVSIEPTQFCDRVDRVARGLLAMGAAPGDRVAVMIPPGIDLSVVVYACWQAGLTAVLVDSALGVKGMHAAVRSAAPQWLIGIPPAVTAARTLRWTGRRIVAGAMSSRLRSTLGVERSLRELEFAGESASQELVPPADDDPADRSAAVVFTSGSTGPSKGVRYRAGHIGAQRDAIAELYGITSEDRLVAAFAPFALYGPALGITSVVPDMDVTKPGTLTAAALGEAAAQVKATMVFASPAALANVVATAESMEPAHRAALGSVRLIMSAGAPLRLELLQAVARLCPSAEIHTPYGMTEILPVADVSLAVRLARGDGPGVCVGRPLQGVDVRIHPLDPTGRPAADATDAANVLGEVVVRGAHGKASYDRLWWTEYRSRTSDRWHRTGDIGTLDADGFLWISGRVQHVISAVDGPVAPIPLEHAAEGAPGVQRAAAVGVGPESGQVIAVVVEVADTSGGPVAPREIAGPVREAISEAGLPSPAAVLVMKTIPVDKRHNSKVGRTAVADWAERVLAGERGGRV